MFLVHHIALFLLLTGVFPWVHGVTMYRAEFRKRKRLRSRGINKPNIVAVVKSAILIWTSLICMLIFTYLFNIGVFKIPMGYTFTTTVKITDVQEQLSNHEDFRLGTTDMLDLLTSKESINRDDYLYNTVDYSLTGKYISLYSFLDFLETENPDIVLSSSVVENFNTEKLLYTGVVKKVYINEVNAYKIGDYYLSGASIGTVLPSLDLSKPVTIDIVFNKTKVDSSNLVKEYKIINATTD